MSKRDAIEELFMSRLLRLQPAKAIQRAIENNEQAILDLNRQQLDRGQDADGKSLGRYRNFRYKGRFQPVDLKLTGDLRNKETIGVDDKKSEFFSQDWKDPVITKRYGKKVWGIQQQLLPNMQDIIRPDLFKEVKQQFTS